MTRTVVVTDGEQRAALAVVRSLGRAGYRVHVCSARPNSIAGASRYCLTTRTVADPLKQPARYLAELIAHVRELRAEILLPVTEGALLEILPHRDSFPCAIPFASAESFLRLSDKREVLSTAERHGIAVPKQLEIERQSDLSAAMNGQLPFPVVIKPSRSISGKSGHRLKQGVSYASHTGDLREALSAAPPNAYPLLLQERIRGAGFGISVLMWDGDVVAAFGHRRIREKPPSGGVSVLSESISLDSGLLSKSLALLRDFRWRGVAMVEYKLDENSGVPYLMEINGRFWGSLQLAIDAGVDFPRLLVEVAAGKKPQTFTNYPVGMRLRWEWGEVDHLVANLRNTKLESQNPIGMTRQALSAVGVFCSDVLRTRNGEIFRGDDPLPFFQETTDWLRRR